MGAIARWTSKGQLLKYTFMQDAVAANQSAAAMGIVETFDGTALGTLGVTEYASPFDFDVVAIALRSDSARTAGTLTADATINGTATGLQAILDATNTQTHSARQRRGSDRGVRDQRLGVKLTTDASWAPATADIVVEVYVIVALEGV